MTKAVLAAACVLSQFAGHLASAKTKVPAKPTPTPRPASVLENHQNLILKAQNLTLQRDRLQASQILIRAIQSEGRGSSAYRDLTKALSELSTVFYTEKAQAAFSMGEAAVETRPREAMDNFQEALKIEDGNVDVLKALARAHLALGECEKAETSIRAAEGVDPYSAEVKLLGLQALVCNKSFETLASRLEAADAELDSFDPFVKQLRYGLQIQSALSKSKPDLKKAKAALSAWEALAPEYPEFLLWKWEISKASGSPDRTAAVKYAQACQNLTPRKRKSYSLDVNSCKSKDAVESYLKESGLSSVKPTSPSSP